MGNAQSTDNECPRNPLCRALCWGGAALAAEDDGEWFDTTRRAKRRRSKKARSQRSLNPMPVVPEEGDAIATPEEGTSLFDTPELVVDTAVRDAVPNALSKPSRMSRAKSESSTYSLAQSKSARKKKKPKRMPKMKLTFVNGQFVDLLTGEGQEMVRKAEDEEEGSGPIAGILASCKTGHCGILGAPPDATKEKSSSSLSLSVSVKALSRLESISRGKSTDSTASLDSVCTQGSLPIDANVKEAVCSIVVLGDGYLLTASKCDRSIKMWKVETADGKTNVDFVREFVGHHVGVTCLAKVDDKGRFLSASKDRALLMWDSRFNCKDSEDATEHKTLLATFSDVDRRSIRSIAITDDGSYVRPTDKIDFAMAAAMAKKAAKEGSGSMQKAARERQILACSCHFATMTGKHTSVKLWSTKHVEPNEDGIVSKDENAAEIKLEQELEHDAVVESIAAVRRKGLLLTGDRMGVVRLWHAVKNVFLPGSACVWSCVRTFSWRTDALSSVTEARQFAVTSLAFLQGNTAFVAGSKSGNLRVWDVEGTKCIGETVTKEMICISGAHSESITAVQSGPTRDDDKNLSFSSASEDGKVLSFSLHARKDGACTPCCFNVVNHGIANRYVVDADPFAVTALACLRMPCTDQDILVTGGSDGNVNLLKPAGASKEEEQTDALVFYRSSMEEESLTLNAVAWEISNEGGVDLKDRKVKMQTYKGCFSGNDAVTWLVEHEHAATRRDAVDLCQVLRTHLSLFDAVCRKDSFLKDDAKALYRFSSASDDDARRDKLKKAKSQS
ncbi:hypothetical protein ACHAXT_004101 [Thalassiosira profunda]